MTRVDFLNKLSAAISDLPESERNKAIAYYSEIIADKVENGEDEENVINQFGDVRHLANEIREDAYPNNNNVQEEKKPLSPWLVILLIFCSPIIFGLAMAAFGVLIAIFASVFSIIFAFFVSSVAIGLAGVALFLTAFVVIFVNPLFGLMQLGSGLFCVGISIFMFAGTYSLTKVVINAISAIGNSIKKKKSK
ncbi:MAG: DUF1700 domain-containing protein [Oscillospiraceae bacterium]